MIDDRVREKEINLSFLPCTIENKKNPLAFYAFTGRFVNEEQLML